MYVKMTYVILGESKHFFSKLSKIILVRFIIFINVINGVKIWSEYVIFREYGENWLILVVVIDVIGQKGDTGTSKSIR